MVAVGGLLDRYRALRRAAIYPGHQARRVFAAPLRGDGRALVVGIYVFVAQCRVGAPASDCVSDALVESVDGGSAVDRTLFAELVLQRYLRAPGLKSVCPVRQFAGEPPSSGPMVSTSPLKVSLCDPSRLDLGNRPISPGHPIGSSETRSSDAFPHSTWFTNRSMRVRVRRLSRRWTGAG
jgi:hypothetical protein